MTYDLVVLTRQSFNVQDIVAGMVAAGKELLVRQVADGAVIQLCDEAEQPLVAIEVPMLLQVPGEVERVLGPVGEGPVEVPVWWMEMRAADTDHGADLAHAFADEVAGRVGGQTWVGQPRPEMGSA